MSDAIKSPVLMNAENMAASFPDTFELLPRDQRENLGPGYLVKVATGGERFWVRVVAYLVPGVYHGEIVSDLMAEKLHGLKKGDVIRFAPENVYHVEQA